VTLLSQLLAELPFTEEDTLVFLGDYLDRGEDSLATIRCLQEIQRKHPGSVFLRGNHEDAWLERWDGKRFTDPPYMPGAMEIWDECDGEIPFEIGRWLAEETVIEYEDEHAYYVHAGLLPGKPAWRTPPFFKMWGGKEFLQSAYHWDKPIIFGHWQFPEPLIQPHKIGIDTGAYSQGVLTAIRMPDRQIFQVRRMESQS
jgi:serine/threonine protein phosphatase 1